MPQWIHDRAMSMLPDMKKTYGPEKAKEVAFAVATQQAHAVGKSPKTWHGKPFGTPEGKREAKQKFDEPSKMQKSADLWATVPKNAPLADLADGHLGRLLYGPGSPKAGHGPEVLAHQLSTMRNIVQGKGLEGIPAKVVPALKALASREGRWMAENARSAGKIDPSLRQWWMVRPDPFAGPKLASSLLDTLMGKIAEGDVEHKGPGFQVVDHTGNRHWLDASTIHSKSDLEKAVTPLMSECPHGIVREKIEEAWKALAENRQASGQPAPKGSEGGEKTAAAAIDQGSQVRLGSTNRDREILRPTVTPSVMASSQVPLTPQSGMGQTNTSIAAAEPTEDQVSEFFKRHPNPPDDVLHRWAESRGWEPDEVEGLAYRLATRHSQFASGGKANDENKKPSDFSPDQIAKGMKVEQEHTPNPEDRKRIATDHLSEDPKYYNDPLFKSDLAKKAVLEGIRKLFKEPPKKRVHEQIDLADEAASRAAVKWASLAPVIPHFLDALGRIR